MYFPTIIENRFPHCSDYLRKFISSNMRMGIDEYIFIGAKVDKPFQRFQHIAAFFATGIELSVGIGSCAAFPKTIITFRVYNLVFIDGSQITAALPNVFPAFKNNWFQARFDSTKCSVKPCGACANYCYFLCF